MKTATREYEKKILSDVLRQSRNAEKTLRQQNVIRRLLFILGYSGLLFAFVFALNEVWHPFTTAFLAAVSGCAIGLALFLNFAYRQWQITRNHVDLASIEKRLAELELQETNGPDA